MYGKLLGRTSDSVEIALRLSLFLLLQSHELVFDSHSLKFSAHQTPASREKRQMGCRKSKHKSRDVTYHVQRMWIGTSKEEGPGWPTESVLRRRQGLFSQKGRHKRRVCLCTLHSCLGRLQSALCIVELVENLHLLMRSNVALVIHSVQQL